MGHSPWGDKESGMIEQLNNDNHEKSPMASHPMQKPKRINPFLSNQRIETGQA